MQTNEVKTIAPGVHRLTVVISLLAIVVGPLLYLLPARTDKLFAWTILPPLTAMFLGGAYLTALVIERLAAGEKIWANVRAVYPGMLIFTSLTLIATLLHIDKFHFQSPDLAARLTAWAWLIIYALAPPVMAALLVVQARRPGSDPPRGGTLPPLYSAALMLQSVVMLLLGIILFLAPGLAGSVWPWQLTPLTAAAVGSWLMGLGFALGHSALENAWERIRIAAIGNIVMGSLQLIAIVRFAPGLQWRTAPAWVYVLFLLSTVGTGAAGLLQIRTHGIRG